MHEVLGSARMSDFFELLEPSEQRLIHHILFYPEILTQNLKNETRHVWFNDLSMAQLTHITGTQFKDTRDVYSFLHNLSLKEFYVDGFTSWITCRYTPHPDLSILISDPSHIGLYLWTDTHRSQLISYINDLSSLKHDSRFVNLQNVTKTR